MVKNKKKAVVKAVTDEATKKLLSTVGVCKGGPKDLADKHDFYLYGTQDSRDRGDKNAKKYI